MSWNLNTKAGAMAAPGQMASITALHQVLSAGAGRSILPHLAIRYARETGIQKPHGMAILALM